MLKLMATIRKLIRSGNRSSYIALPTGLLRALGWRKKQRLSVTKQGGAIVVRDARTRRRKR